MKDKTPKTTLRVNYLSIYSRFIENTNPTQNDIDCTVGTCTNHWLWLWFPFSKPHESNRIRHQHRRIPKHRSFPLGVFFNPSMLLSTKTYPVNQLVMKHQQTSELQQKQVQSLPADGVGLRGAVNYCFGLYVQCVLSDQVSTAVDSELICL